MSILAIGRADGTLALWCMYEPTARVTIYHDHPITSLSWRPRTAKRYSEHDWTNQTLVTYEDLVMGDERGVIYYYGLEWTTHPLPEWLGTVSLYARIQTHVEQVCGIAWSPDGKHFATGGNDNAVCLYDAHRLIEKHLSEIDFDWPTMERVNDGHIDEISGSEYPKIVCTPKVDIALSQGEYRPRHRWIHRSAVKAMAFCPWQTNLLATGGGVTDRVVHFVDTHSGAWLAHINVMAQVTSLVWSKNRKEIAATFGFAMPEHPYRVAVYTWPACHQVVAIPWDERIRALHAIPYPGTFVGRDGRTINRHDGGTESYPTMTPPQDCLAIVASDETIRFHQIWSSPRRGSGGGGGCGGGIGLGRGRGLGSLSTAGIPGGSPILEGLLGIDPPGSNVIH